MRSLGLAIVVGTAAVGMVAGCGLMMDYSDYETVPATSGGGTPTTTTNVAGTGGTATGTGGTATGTGGEAGAGAVGGGSGGTGGTVATGGTGGTVATGGTGGTVATGGTGGSGGGPCLGCIDTNGDCVAGTQLGACGKDGGTCLNCFDNDPCTFDRCMDGNCAPTPVPNAQPCEPPLAGRGVCMGGVCYEEICNDGLDNDGDTFADCADSFCTDVGWTCVAPPPGDWAGPVVVGYDDPISPTLACADQARWPGHGTAAFMGLVAPPAVCSACSCVDPTGSCGAGRVAFRMGVTTTCATSGVCNQGYDLPSDGSCTQLQNTCGAPPAEKMSTTFANEGSGTSTCTPSGGVATVVDEGWQHHLVACNPVTMSGCGGTQTCAPPQPAGSEWADTYCIWNTGDRLCPAGPYSHRRVAFTAPDTTDTRGCNACTCGTVANGCNGTVSLYSNASCTTFLTSYPVDTAWNGCDMLGLGPTMYGTYVPNPAPCPASGGEPTGAVDPTGEMITVCCTNQLPN